MKYIILLFLTFFLFSCGESTTTKALIIDKSFGATGSNKTTISSNKIKSKPKFKKRKASVKPNKDSAWIYPIDAKIKQKWSKNNKSISFVAIKNLAIKSIKDGIVVYGGDSLKAFGKMIIIKHKFGFYSHYMFVGKIKVAVGDVVKQGYIIALSGKKSLKLVMRKNTIRVNPKDYL